MESGKWKVESGKESGPFTAGLNCTNIVQTTLNYIVQTTLNNWFTCQFIIHCCGLIDFSVLTSWSIDFSVLTSWSGSPTMSRPLFVTFLLAG